MNNETMQKSLVALIELYGEHYLIGLTKKSQELLTRRERLLAELFQFFKGA